MHPLSPSRAPLWLAAALLACDPAAATEPSSDEVGAAPRRAAAASDPATHAASAGVPGRSGAPSEPAAAVEGSSDPLHLRPPPMRAAADVGRYQASPAAPRGRVAQAFQFDAPVFQYPGAARRIAGLVRRNTRLAVDRWVPGEGCSKSWYALVGGGYVCSGEGFSVSSDPAALPEALQIEPPAVDDALPYRYAKVKTPAPLYWRLPTADELASRSSAPIREYAQGAHFVGMDQTHEVGDTILHRTVRGFYVRDADLEAKPAPTMHGELLDGPRDLPLAFVHVDEATLCDAETGAVRGRAERFARFAVAELRPGEAGPQVLARDGFAVADDEVRVARLRPRPEGVAPGDQWIHIDLDQQVLVAYEGDRPVLATLVSSGKEGFEPPRGTFRVHKKYTTVTMAGPDPDAGTYAVEQVPWTMYYWGSFALHGAYWHDTFGNVRSHGCTNLPPIDARWLFYWSEPALSPGWHAEVGLRKGPWVHFTSDNEGDDAGSESATRSAAP